MSMTNYDAWKTSPPDEPDWPEGNITEILDELGRDKVFGEADEFLEEEIRDEDSKADVQVFALLAKHTDDDGELDLEAFAAEASPVLTALCKKAAINCSENDTVRQEFGEVMLENKYHNRDGYEEWD